MYFSLPHHKIYTYLITSSLKHAMDLLELYPNLHLNTGCPWNVDAAEGHVRRFVREKFSFQARKHFNMNETNLNATKEWTYSWPPHDYIKRLYTSREFSLLVHASEWTDELLLLTSTSVSFRMSAVPTTASPEIIDSNSNFSPSCKYHPAIVWLLL